MTKPTFQMIEIPQNMSTEGQPKHPGFYSIFTDPKGETTTSFWTSPPSNLTGIGRDYLQHRHSNIINQKRLDFFIQEFNHYMTMVENNDLTRFNTENIDFVWVKDALENDIQHIIELNLTPEDAKRLIIEALSQYIRPGELKIVPSYEFARLNLSKMPDLTPESISLTTLLKNALDYHDELLNQNDTEAD